MLSIKNLTKTYVVKGSDSNVVALNDVSITFPDKGLVFILGKSGSGKSTLLNVLGGIDTPTEGELIIDGVSTKTFSQDTYDSYRNTYISFVFQDFGLIEEFTVYQNISFAIELQGKKANPSEISALLASLDLEGYKDRKINSLSGGQKQRVSIARAIIKNPKAFLADEPTGSLDSENSNSVLSLLKRLSEDKLVIVVSHDRESAKQYGDRIIELKDGRIISDETHKESQASQVEESAVFKKARLPFSKGMRIGISSSLRKPFKLAITMLLSAVSFSLFGFVSTLVFYDDASVRSDIAKKLHSTSDLFGKNIIYKKKEIEYDYLEDKPLRTSQTIETRLDMISKDEIRALNAKTKTGLDFAGVYGKKTNLPFEIELNDNYENPLVDKIYSCSFFSGFSDCGDEYLKRNGMPLEAGSYPRNADEIAISKYHATLITKYLSENGVFDNFSDLIGKAVVVSLRNSNGDSDAAALKISGIYDTGTIDEYYLKRFNYSNGRVDTNFFSDYQEYMRGSMHCLGFVAESFYEEYGLSFKTDSSLYDLNSIYFGDVSFWTSLDKSNNSFSKYEEIILPRFTNMKQLSFYDRNGDAISYENPKRNEVYLDGYYYKNRHYDILRRKLDSSIYAIEEAYRDGILPEFDGYIATESGLNTINSIKAYVTNNSSNLSFGEEYEKGHLKNELIYLLTNFAGTAFKRIYLSSLLQKMLSYNSRCGFNYPDLLPSSDFYGNTVMGVLIPEYASSTNVFDEGYEYIRNNQTLLSFANNILHFEHYRTSQNQDDDREYYEISRLLQSGQGRNISQSLWDVLKTKFEMSCANAESLFFSLSPRCLLSCGINNIIEVNWDYVAPSLDDTFVCPSELSYANSAGNSGTLTVKGYFESHIDQSIYSPAFLMNEEFINLVASCPRYISYRVIETDYEPVEEAKYNYIITKSSFSIPEVREICSKGKGYEYRFCNEKMSAIDFFLTQFNALYIYFLIGAVILALFAGLLLGTFISSSIDYRRKEIGIIRCLGGRKKDIFTIFFMESLIIALGSAIISCPITMVMCHLINGFVGTTFEINVLSYGLLNVLTVILVSLLFSVASTALPIWKKTKISPYESFRKE